MTHIKTEQPAMVRLSDKDVAVAALELDILTLKWPNAAASVIAFIHELVTELVIEKPRERR